MLRSPNGATLVEMYNYPNTYDLSALSQYHYNLVVLLMSIAGGSAKSEHSYGMNGMMQSLFPNGKEAVEALQEYGLVEKDATLDKALNNKTIPDLKSMLQLKDLKINGRKADLIGRLTPALTDNERKALIDSSLFWKPTPLGFEYIHSLYKEREHMEKSAITAFLNSDFDYGANIIRKYKARYPVSGGINEGDFSHITQEARILKLYFNQNDMNIVSAIACYQYLYGGELIFPPSINVDGPNVQAEKKLEIRYISSAICTYRDLVSYRELDIKNYEILFCDDACKICKKAGNGVHNVIEAKIGINAPPFHLGCRCCITTKL